MLNVISFSYAYSLYSLATFHHRLSLSLIPASQLEATIQAKYTSRGWTFMHMIYHCAQCPHCVWLRKAFTQAFPVGLRWIGDRHSWVLPLNMEGVELPTTLGDGVSPPVPRDPCFVTTWEMTKWEGRDGAVGRKIKTYDCQQESFWHSYVLTDHKLECVMDMFHEVYKDIPEW